MCIDFTIRHYYVVQVAGHWSATFPMNSKIVEFVIIATDRTSFMIENVYALDRIELSYKMCACIILGTSLVDQFLTLIFIQ